jgi:hypothetical protein
LVSPNVIPVRSWRFINGDVLIGALTFSLQDGAGNRQPKQKWKKHMSRDKHDKQINELQGRHQAVLGKFTSLPAANLEWWRHPWITTPQQLQFLVALVEQLEASQAMARIAAQNLNSALEVVIEANTRTR